MLVRLTVHQSSLLKSIVGDLFKSGVMEIGVDYMRFQASRAEDVINCIAAHETRWDWKVHRRSTQAVITKIRNAAYGLGWMTINQRVTFKTDVVQAIEGSTAIKLNRASAGDVGLIAQMYMVESGILYVVKSGHIVFEFDQETLQAFVEPC